MKDLKEDKRILDEIGYTLESRGYAHMTNAEGIGSILDENEQLREALKPFAQEFEEWRAGGVESGLVDIKAPEDDGCDVAHFTVEDLARAHELCTKHE